MARSVLALTLLLALPAAAQQGPVELVRRLVPGARAKVVETSRIELKAFYQARGAAVGDTEVSAVERRYTEEVRTAQPELLHRSYELSQRVKHRLQATPPAPERTSLHGRALLVAGLELKPDGPFEVSKDDGEALRLDRLAAALLPAAKVARGESWTVGPEPLVQALFGPYVVPSTTESAAKVALKQVKAKGGLTRATLEARLSIHVPKSDTTPEVTIQLAGEVVWGVEPGRALEARLEGTVAYVVDTSEGRLRAEGPLSWSLQAEPIEGRAPATEAQRATGLPPPPGAQALVCRQHPEHAYPLGELVRCMQCGGELEASTRRCPKGHPWPLQYCPRDGAPLDAR
jgi:hypothetical protein